MTFHRWIIVCYSLLAIVAIGQAGENAEGGLKFIEKSVDVGFVPTTNSISRTFPFEVVGHKEVLIVKTASNCGCSAVAAEKKKYQPGEKGEVRLDLNPRGFVGPFRKEAYIKDSNGKLHLLEIHGIAPGMKDLDSKGAFGAVPKGTVMTNHFQLFVFSTKKVIKPQVTSDEPQKFVVQEIRQNVVTNMGSCYVIQIAFEVAAKGDQLTPGLNRSLLRCGLKDVSGYETTIGLLAKGHQDYEIMPDVLYVSQHPSTKAKGSQMLGPILIRIEMVGKAPQVTEIRLGNQTPKWDVMEQEKNWVLIRLLNLPELLKLDMKSPSLQLSLKGEKIEIPIRRLAL